MSVDWIDFTHGVVAPDGGGGFVSLVLRTLNPKLGTSNPEPEWQNSRVGWGGARQFPKFRTLNPEPGTLNSVPQILNPKS